MTWDVGRIVQKERRRYQSFMVRGDVVRQPQTTKQTLPLALYENHQCTPFTLFTISVGVPGALRLIGSANKVHTKVRDLVLKKYFRFPPLLYGYGSFILTICTTGLF